MPTSRRAPNPRPGRAACAAALTLLAARAPAADDPALRSRLDAVLERMEHAVLAGDPDAYLACVLLDPPEFAAEQRHWAADLRRHVPAAFDLRASDEPLVLADDGRVRVTLTMQWTMPGGAATPRRVEYPVEFARSDPGDGAMLYAGEVWERAEGTGVLALCAAGEGGVGAVVVDVLPAVREHVHEGFELVLDRVQVVKVYASMEHLQASIYLSYSEPLAGWNEPGESIKILADSARGRHAARVLLAHEYAHVATFSMGDAATAMPWWAAEGVAELAAERFSRGRRAVDAAVRDLAASGAIVPWERLADFRAVRPEESMFAYTQGHHFVGYVSDRFGRSARNAWIRELTRGRSLDDATRAALGLGFDDLDAQWRASLAPAPP